MQASPAGWFHFDGDPTGSLRYWDGDQWQGDPEFFAESDSDLDIDPHAESGSGPEDEFGSEFGSEFGMATEFAGPGRRILARMIDLFVYQLLAVAVGIAGHQRTVAGPNQDDIAAWVVASLVTTALVGFVEVYLVATGGQTIGKLVMKIIVVNDDGSDVNLVTSIKRFSPFVAVEILRTLSYLAVGSDVYVSVQLVSALAWTGLGLVSLIWLLTKNDYKAVWDRLAGTIVIKA